MARAAEEPPRSPAKRRWIRRLPLRATIALVAMALLSPGCGREAPEAGSVDGTPVLRGAGPPAAPAPASEAPPAALALGDKLDAVSLGARESHDYHLEAEAEEILVVRVEQQGVDVELFLYSPSGKPLAHIDSPSGAWGDETLLYVTPEAGTYRLEVRGGASGGLYGLSVAEHHAAGDRDRKRHRAERAFDAAEELRRTENPKDLRQAVRELEGVLGVFRELDEVEGQARVFHRMGLCYQLLGEQRRAVEAFEQALKLFDPRGQRHLRVLTLQHLGSLSEFLGEYRRSRDYYLEAHQARVELADREERAKTANNLATAQLRLGEMQEALHLYDQALLLWQEIGNRKEVATTRHNRGRCYLELGDFEAALDDLRQALALRVELGDRLSQASTLAAIGAVHESRGELDEAFRDYEQALSLREELGGRIEQAVALSTLARLLSRRGRVGEALERLRRAQRLFEAVGNPRREAWCLLSIGLALQSTGDADGARRSLTDAQRLFEKISLPEGELAGLYALASLERQANRPEAARSYLERSVAKIEALRSRPLSQPLRTSYFATKQDHYEALVSVLMDLHVRDPGAGHDHEALTVAERARARSQLETLAESYAGLRGAASPEQRRRLQELNREIHAQERLRRSLIYLADDEGASEAQMAEVERELRSLLRESERIRGEIRRTSPRFDAFAQKPLTAGEIQGLLDDGTLLLQYMLGDEKSYVWAVSAGTIRCFELAKRDQIEDQARRTYRLLALSHQREGRVGSQMALVRLADLILGPLEGLLGDGRRLLVVADGALQYIPFGALPAPGTGTRHRPLVADHEMASVPSASMLAMLNHALEARPKAPASVAMVADPVFQRHDPRFEDVDGPGTEASSGSRKGTREFERLVYSRQEAEAVLAHVSPERQLRVFGFDANLELVLGGTLRDYEIVHFATHGELDSARPELSRLVLSLLDRSGNERDGFLYAHDIYDLDLTANLVVLSACETALGKEIRGEGLVGLTQAFFYAGAGRVMVSLWQVNDQATAELMGRFYRHLLEDGLRPADALRQAQVEVAREKAWQAPYYWAGFLLQGPW